MKCSRCGRRNKANAVVCHNCGAALIPQPAERAFAAEDTGVGTASAEPAPAVNEAGSGAYTVNTAPRRRSKAWLWALLAAALLLAAAYLIFFAGDSLGHYMPGSNSYTVLTPDSNGSGILYKGKRVFEDEADVLKTDMSLDARTLGVLDVDGTLYCCRKGKTQTVDASVSDFTVCDSGSRIFYTDSTGKLFTFNCKKKDAAPVCLCSEAVLPDYAVSTEGKYVLFSEAKDGTLYLCTVSNGKETKLDKGLKPIAVTDNAKYIYAYNEEDCSLYQLNKRGGSTCVRGGVGSNIWFNYDHSEMAFTSEAANGNVKTLVYRQGREYEVAGLSLAPVMSVSMLPHAAVTESFNTVTCPVKSFDERLFGGDGLVMFTFDGSTQVGTIRLESAVLSDDLKQLYYTNEGRLWHAAAPEFNSAERISDDCVAFISSKNGKALWYVDSGSSLYCVNNGSTERVCEGVSDFAAAPNGREALYIVEGKVYYCKLNILTKPKELGVEADSVAINGDGMFVFDGAAWQGVTRSGKLFDPVKESGNDSNESNE